MTSQQLTYLVALNKHRHFVKAAAACAVTQPTLSMMIAKLEQELDVQLIDRSKHPIEPTPIGTKIIQQAEKSLQAMQGIHALIQTETNLLEGSLRIGLIPTLAPYLIPPFIQDFQQRYPQIDLHISELETEALIDALERGQMDMFIAATPLEQQHFYEIPLYYERFVAYFSSDHLNLDKPLSAANLPKDNLWVLEDGHCLRTQVFNFCKKDMNYNHTFEAGSIDTLIRIVDQNGGYTIIPELHLAFLSPKQKKNIRPIDRPPAIREVSVVISQYFVHEKMLNAVADCVKSIIPAHMIDTKLKKYSIRLR